MDPQTMSFISELAESHYHQVYSLCAKLATKMEGNHLDAEDLAQSVFEIAIAKSDHLQNHEAPLAWLYQTTKHVFFNQHRLYTYRQHRELYACENDQYWLSAEDPSAQLAFELALFDPNGIQSDIHCAAAKLKRDDGLLFHHLIVLKSSKEEMLALFKVSDTTLRKKVSRMRKRLRTIWEKDFQ